MIATTNWKILVGSVGFILSGLLTLAAAASYQGPVPLWLRLLSFGLFMVSAALWLIGYRKETTRSRMSSRKA
jgi:hypothetical protein